MDKHFSKIVISMLIINIILCYFAYLFIANSLYKTKLLVEGIEKYD